MPRWPHRLSPTILLSVSMLFLQHPVPVMAYLADIFEMFAVLIAMGQRSAAFRLPIGLLVVSAALHVAVFITAVFVTSDPTLPFLNKALRAVSNWERPDLGQTRGGILFGCRRA